MNKDIDETKLSPVERLGLAWCRLNIGEWDTILGKESEREFDDMFYYRKMMAIEEIIGEANTSKSWWIFELGRTEEEWKLWYYSMRNRGSTREEAQYKLHDARQGCYGEKRCSNKLKKLPYIIRALFAKK